MKHVGFRVEGSTSRTDTTARALAGDGGFVDLAVAGTEVAGEFRCADCGYGVVVRRVLPSCPICAGTVWESRRPVPPRLLD